MNPPGSQITATRSITAFPASPFAEFPRVGMLLFAGFMLLMSSGKATAASIGIGDVTSSLGPTFYVDDASTGGNDAVITQPAVASYNRSFAGLLNTNQGLSRVTITGFGFATSISAPNNTATSITLTFTYLGADEAMGGGDDVVMGSATGNYHYTSNGEYAFAFDTPLTADLDITGTRFLIQVAPSNATSNGKVLFKTTNASTGPLTYEVSNGPRFSVAGIVVPLGVNLAKFRPVSTSSVTGQRLASYLTDGDAGNDNRWQSSNTGPHWARVDFPYPVEVGSAQVFSGFNDINAQENFRIQYLIGASWVAAPGAVITGNTNIERNIVFTSPVTASSFRIHSTDGTMIVRELAFYPPNGLTGFPLGTDVRLNLAQQRLAVANANTAENFPLLAVDGRVNEASKWQTSTAGATSLEIDLIVSTKIGSAHLYSGSSGVAPLADFELKYWNGSAWQAIPGGTVAGNASAALVIPFSSSVTTSKVMLEFNNPGTTSVRELCIFPANEGNAGYPLGTGVSGLPPLTAKSDDYRDAFHIITNSAASQAMAVNIGVPGLNQSGLTISDRQYQILLNLDSGSYRLRNRATGLCLSGAQLSKSPGAALIDAPYAAMPDQDWILDAIGTNNFCLVNRWSGLVIDTQGGATAQGTPLVQNPRSGSPTQSWQISYSTHSPKKGVGGTSFATTIKSNWAYNWGLLNSHTLPAGSLFHPMQWGNYNLNFSTPAGSLWKSYSAYRTAGHPLYLLGFNEPDKFNQSGDSLDLENTNAGNFSLTRSVNTAVALWPRHLAMDQPLVSPAPASMNNGWLADFFTQANSRGYRVDYTALHSYPSPGGGSANSLINSLLSGYNNWNRPVWLTEFSFVNWEGDGTWTEEDNYNCLAEFMWRAESLPWLQKYALFVFKEAGINENNPASPAPEHPWSPVGPRSNSIDLNDNLTAFGKLYAAWDGDATVRSAKTYHIHNRGTRKRLTSSPGQSTAAARNIRNDSAITHWTLVSTGANNRYYLVSQSDGRRLGFANGGSVDLTPPGTSGTAVEWSLTESEHGWHYVGHPATAKRLKMAYNNSTSTATYTMAATSDTTDSAQWRFIVPMLTPVWSGATSTDWTQAGNWGSGLLPSTGDQVTFDGSSTANLDTVLNDDFNLSGISANNPAGPVSISGTNSLTLGTKGLDLSAATHDFTINSPLILSAPQSWNIANGQTLSVNGGVSGAFAVTIQGPGVTSLGAAVNPLVPLTIDHDGTLKMGASGVLSSNPTAVHPVVNGTLDLNGTSQAINFLGGSGVIDNTAPGNAVLTITNDAADTLNAVIQNTNGTLALVKDGSANLTLPSANTFSGGFANNGTGNVYPQDNAAFGTGPVVMNDATLYATAGSYTFTNTLTLNGATLRIGGGNSRTITWSGPVSVTASSGLNADGGTAGITLSGGLDMNDGGHTLTSSANGTAHTLSAPVSGASGTIMVTLGALNLNAANPFGGTFRSSAGGPLRVGDALAMQNATLDMNAADAGSVSLNGFSATIGALTGSRNFGLGSGTVSIGNNHSSTTYSGVLSGSGSLVKIGNGTLTLSGANHYGGTTTVSAGTLALGANNVLPDTPLSIGDATLNAAGFSDTFGALEVTGTATLHLGEGAALVFSNSSGVDWTGGSLNITGTVVSGTSLRFGTTSTGLTPGQLALITVNGSGGPFTLDANGFLTATPVFPGYDTWKTQINNGLDGRSDDADGDGFTNLQEFLFGTSPIAGNGSLVGTTPSGGNLVLRWLQRRNGATYQLRQSATLAGESWVPVVSPIPALDADQTGAPADYDYLTVTLPTDGDKEFFHIEGAEN